VTSAATAKQVNVYIDGAWSWPGAQLMRKGSGAGGWAVVIEDNGKIIQSLSGTTPPGIIDVRQAQIHAALQGIKAARQLAGNPNIVLYTDSDPILNVAKVTMGREKEKLGTEYSELAELVKENVVIAYGSHELRRMRPATLEPVRIVKGMQRAFQHARRASQRAAMSTIEPVKAEGPKKGNKIDVYVDGSWSWPTESHDKGQGIGAWAAVIVKNDQHILTCSNVISTELAKDGNEAEKYAACMGLRHVKEIMGRDGIADDTEVTLYSDAQPVHIVASFIETPPRRPIEGIDLELTDLLKSMNAVHVLHASDRNDQMRWVQNGGVKKVFMSQAHHAAWETSRSGVGRAL